MAVVERPTTENDNPGPPEADLLFKEAKQRERRRRLAWFCTALMVAGAAAAIVAAATTGHLLARLTTVSTPTHPKATGSSGAINVNLDILSAQTQLTVRLTGTSSENSHAVARSASPSAAAAVAFPRQGYVLGTNGGGYVSLSNDLQKVLHVWSLAQGQYAAPASNPSDVWLSSPYATPSHTQEFNMVEKVVGLAISIPPGSIVLGQVGPVLVLQSAQPSPQLELWNPSTQTIVASLGPFDQLAVSSTSVAWTLANSLDVANAHGTVQQQPSGPAGDVATALAFSPRGLTLAIAWAPSAGSEFAGSRGSIDRHSSLSLLRVGAGQLATVPGGQGTGGPLTWSADGTRIFFAQSSANGTSVGISTYRMGETRAKKLNIPGLTLPSYFGPPTGSVFVWDSSPRDRL